MYAQKLDDMGKLLAAIDLGTSVIRGMIVEKDEFGKMIILATESEKTSENIIKKGAVANPDSVAFLVKQILVKMMNTINNGRESDQKLELKKVYVGLNGESLQTIVKKSARNFDGEITQELVDELTKESSYVSNQDLDVLYVSPQEYILDDEEETSVVGCFCSNRIEGSSALVVANKELKSRLQSAFKRAFQEGDVECEIVIQPIALADFLLTKYEKETGCLFIDFGAGTTSYAIYTNGYLRKVGTVGLGGNSVTKDLKDLKISFDDANLLKRKPFATCYPIMLEKPNTKVIFACADGMESIEVNTGTIGEIIQARMKEIINKIGYQAQFLGLSNIKTIVISGGASKMHELPELLAATFGMNIRRVWLKAKKSNPDFEKNIKRTLNILDNRVGNIVEFNLDIEWLSVLGILNGANESSVRKENNSAKTKRTSKSRGSSLDIKGKLVGLFDNFFSEDESQRMN